MASRQPFPPHPRPRTSIIFLAITISSSLIILIAILYFLYYVWYSLVHRSRTSPIDATAPLNKLKRFSYKELKNSTHNFSSSNCIGKGGSGTVFKGILRDGKLVAVKLLDSNSVQCELEFENELKILDGLNPCPLIVSLLGFCAEKGKRLVVYEYMPNKSLQESLFLESENGDSCNLGLNWGKRFSIILDVAKALAFLHLECEPPVIHGDVKPSNVLLDSEFKAKLSDFGLSRLKLEEDFGIDLFSQELGKSQELWKSQELCAGGRDDTPGIGTPVESHENDEVDFAMALQASSSSKNSCKIYNNVMGFDPCSLNFNSSSKCENEKGKGLSRDGNCGVNWNQFVACDNKELDLSVAISNIDHSNEIGAKQWGKDWWLRQGGSGELYSKDYVMEWIGSQICHSAKTNWDEEEKGGSQEKTNLDNPIHIDKFEGVSENTPTIQESRLGGSLINGAVEKDGLRIWQSCSRKHRKMHEWWKEERMHELSKKGRKMNWLGTWKKKHFKVPRFGLGKSFRFNSSSKSDQENHSSNERNVEFSFRRGWKKSSPSVRSDRWSGDLFSRELSSTTSMRGTLGYVAPEYGGCGFLMEKSDIYSFGVLILVIVSGRRPLHILSPPMNLEKTNLISWARHLAHSGNILELMDQRLRDEYSKKQASLCISLALACLQRMPELRPDIGDIVKILKGEMELPPLPFEFSPSPPSKCVSKSRRKQKNNVE